MADRPQTVVLLCSDLMMTSTVGSAAAQAGRTLTTVTSASQLSETVNDGDLVFIDLATAGLDIGAAAASLSEEQRQTAVVYGPHVQTRHFEAARAAGFATVIPRGRFAATVTELVAK